MKRSTYFLLLALLASFFRPTSVQAQMDTLIYHAHTLHIEPEDKGDLRLTLDVMPFVRNNEYKSRLVKGYTLPGIWLDPTLSFQPLHNLKIEAGLHALHFWGANKYPNFNYSKLANWHGHATQNGFHCVPTFRAQMQLTPTLNILLGTLHGKNNHALIEPLYNEELNLSADPETGVQILWDCRPVRLDTWLNWESFIFENDKGQESFSFGISARFRPSRRKAPWQWYLPLQAVFQHRGGEINTQAEERSVKTWFNAAAGVGVDVPLRLGIPHSSLHLEATAAYFGQQAGEALPFDRGYGVHGRAALQLWRFQASLGYWWCKDFVSIFGNPLFGAMSIHREGLILDRPQSLTAQIEYTQNLGKGFSWGVHAQILNQFATRSFTPKTGWEHQSSTLNFAAGIYLRACPSFLIKKFQMH